MHYYLLGINKVVSFQGQKIDFGFDILTWKARLKILDRLVREFFKYCPTFFNLIKLFIGHIRQFNKRNKHKVDQTGTYDLNSILHYEENAFAIDPTVPTIIARDIKSNKSFKMGQRERLSRMDIEKINRYYNCSQPDFIQVKKAIETGLSPSNINDVKTEKMHSLKKSYPKSFYWFKSPSDFEIRTGKNLSYSF